MDEEEIIDALRNAECNDSFVCPFGMFGRNKKGRWGCFAIYPNGDPDEPEQKCVAHQAVDLIERLLNKEP